MSTQKPRPNATTPAPEQRDDLTLDAETVKDLEPQDGSAANVRGGRRTDTCSGNTGVGT